MLLLLCWLIVLSYVVVVMLVKSVKLRSVEVGESSKVLSYMCWLKVLSYVGVVMLVKSVKLRSVEVGESSKVFQAGNKGNLRFCSRHRKVANRERSIIELGEIFFFMVSFWFLLVPLNISLCYYLYLRYLGNS